MKNIKFFVFMVFYLSGLLACMTKYCKICPEHTLCIYQEPGPSPQCIGYDAKALLTEDDTNAILDKINERRNFVATGLSRLLPAAADMKKIVWSAELALFAQRWADQCDQSLRPDRNDKCRDIDESEVGQTIATITGPSSSYNVKSFVEIWFMKSMVYTGSVTYYNQSQDHNTNDFTQLIWAETDTVGCGKAKFFVKNAKPVIVDRLVCNFAPKANVHGKPVYTIGYPATQCTNGMEPDKTFPGLCSHQLKPKGILPSSNSPATSLLRIRNLFKNDSTSKEIDPIFNNVKHVTKAFSIMISPQITMQALNYMNNSYDDMKRSYPFQNENIWINEAMNSSTYHHYGDYLQKREKGRSRLYHGHDHKKEIDYLHPETINQNAQRYDYTPTTTLDLYMEQDHRKHNIDQKCTRKTEKKLIDNIATNCASCKINLNKCTRGQKANCPRNNACQLTTHNCDQESRMHSTPHEFCACDSFSPSYQLNPYRRAHNTYCDCVNLDYPTRPCPHMLRTFRDMFNEKLGQQSDLQYYDLLSNIGQQSTRRPIVKDLYRTRKIFDDDSWSPNIKSLDRRKQLKRNNSGRKTRVADEDESFRPFWQVDEFINRNKPELKSMRYTTLSNKKSLNNKRTRKQTKGTMKMESITVAYNKISSNSKRVTEKYLSFDELMHLRKHNVNDSGGRRNFDDKDVLRESDTTTTPASETTTTETTQEYSLNTPYIRMKYCTRKLTCTWTAASLTDSAGSIIGGGGNAIGGSRTPPGYVEGCTRTSTCTRDYMHRNKMATLPVETTTPEPDPGDDEDYCERRSLNRRSNSNYLIADNKSKPFTENSSGQYESNKNNNCICFDTNIRNKRQSYFCNNSIEDKNQKREIKLPIKYETDLLTYGDLYYFVVSKIIDMWKVTKSCYSHNECCVCNGISKLTSCNLFVLVLNYFITFL